MSSRKSRNAANARRKSIVPEITHQSFESDSIPNRSKIIAVILIFVAVFLVYSRTMGHDFVWDDHTYILQDKTIQSLKTLPKAILKPLGFYGMENPQGALWRPVTTLSFGIDSAIWKLNLAGFHLTNILLHACVGILLYFVYLSVLKNNIWALLLSLLYILHPVHAEPVAFINGRHSMLAACFVLIAFLMHRRSAVLASVFFLIAVYSRETSVMLPFTLLFYDRIQNKRLLSAATLKKYLPYAIAILLYSVTRFMILGGIGKAYEGSVETELFSWRNRIWMQPVYFMEYFKMIFTPVNLHMWMQVYYPRNFSDPRYFSAFLSFGAMIAGGIISWKKSRQAFFGLAWFILFLLPVLNLFIIANSPVLNHWLYIPLMGFLLFLFYLLRIFLPGDLFLKIPFQLAAAALIILLGVMASAQSMVWKTEISTFEHISKFVTRDPLIYNNLGTAYIEKGRWQEAKQAYEKALKLDPSYKSADFNLKLLKQSHPEIR